MRKNKQRWEYEEENEYGWQPFKDVEKRKLRRGQRRETAVYEDTYLPTNDEEND